MNPKKNKTTCYLLIIFLLVCFLNYPGYGNQTPVSPIDTLEYLETREKLINLDKSYRLSSNLSLSPEEISADSILSVLKNPYLNLPTWQFPPANLFHLVKAEYDTSLLLNFVKRLPKGGILHLHPSATGPIDLIIEATYDSGAYLYTGPDARRLPNWSLAHGSLKPDGDTWIKVNDLRAKSSSPVEFDRELKEKITIGAEDYGRGDIWDEFEKNFSRKWRLQAYWPTYWNFMEQTCFTLAKEGYQYAEFRTFVGERPYTDGTKKSPEQVVERWIELRNKIKESYPHFDFKLIVAASRWSSPEQVLPYVLKVVELREKYPSMIVGFDLVSEEDKARTNLDFLELHKEIVSACNEKNIKLPLILHAGESNRLNNENLYDAVLLGSKRIGHGYALVRHPELMDMVIKNDVCIEVCPISNQVLGYINDLRNHPAVQFLARGVPFVISSDDPGLMRYTSTYDWLVALLAWDLSLADIKQLVLNSFNYSMMSTEERKEALEVWNKDWQVFVDWINTTYVDVKIEDSIQESTGGDYK